MSLLFTTNTFQAPTHPLPTLRAHTHPHTDLETDGGLSAVRANPAVPKEVLSEISQWKESGIGQSDILQRLRLQMVPAGYVPQTWAGKIYTVIENSVLIYAFFNTFKVKKKMKRICYVPYLHSWSTDTKSVNGMQRVYHFVPICMSPRPTPSQAVNSTSVKILPMFSRYVFLGK